MFPPYVVKNNQIVHTKQPETRTKFLTYENYKTKVAAKYRKEYDFGNFKNFCSLGHQYTTLKYAGNKILLAHKPGFGKTINALLLAWKFRNSCDDPKPKIAVVVPDETLRSQWISDIKKLFPNDYHHFLWYTYNTFIESNTTHEYPEYKYLADKNVDVESLSDVYGETIEKKDIKDLVGKNISEKNFLDGLKQKQYKLPPKATISNKKIKKVKVKINKELQKSQIL